MPAVMRSSYNRVVWDYVAFGRELNNDVSSRETPCSNIQRHDLFYSKVIFKATRMATHYEPSAELPQGLDREPIREYPAISTDDQDSQATHKSENSGMRRKLRHVSQRIASKLHATDNDPPPEHHPEQTAPTLAPPPTQETHNLRLAEDVEQKSQLPDFKQFLHQPLNTLKSVAHKQGGKEFAEAVANTDATHGASVKLVLAHERLVAEASGTPQHAAAGDEFANLKKVRQDAFVRWTLARHVRTVRAVPPEPAPQHQRQDFIYSNGEDGEVRMHWAEYGEHVRMRQCPLFPPYVADAVPSQLLTVYSSEYAGQYIGASSELPDHTAESLSTSFERVLLTSVPFQNGVMKVMSVAFWESPAESAAYALLYFTLCVFNYVTRAIVSRRVMPIPRNPLALLLFCLASLQTQ